MSFEMIRKDVEQSMEDAYKNGIGADGSIASAYFLEAIAKMIYFQTFHSQYEVNENEDSESVDIQSDL